MAAPPETAPTAISEALLPGRYLLGELSAPLQIVVFADFQCGDCQAIEEQLRELKVRRKDVAVSMRHFPLCPDCNTAVPAVIHPNACKAALAAEAAVRSAGAVP